VILRRLAQHVKDQNWFAVALDFVIVVTGILIAFQITNWKTGREDRRVYDQGFERVIAELKVNLVMQQAVREGIAKELPIIQRALEDLRACRADETALANVKAALVPLSLTYMQVVDTAAIEQFLGNDAFLPFQVPETRELLATFVRMENIFREIGLARRAQMVQTAASMPEALVPGPLTVDGPDALKGSRNWLLHREPMLAVPLEIACKDKAFVARFYDWESEAFRVSILAGGTEQSVRKALEALGRPVADEDDDGETP